MTTSCPTPRNLCQLLHLVGDRPAILARRAWPCRAGYRLAVVPDAAGGFRLSHVPQNTHLLDRDSLMARDWYEVRDPQAQTVDEAQAVDG